MAECCQGASRRGSGLRWVSNQDKQIPGERIPQQMRRSAEEIFAVLKREVATPVARRSGIAAESKPRTGEGKDFAVGMDDEQRCRKRD